jgi:hypothetical protein
MNNKVSLSPNPSLKDLEILIGAWDMRLSNASFLPSMSDSVMGHAAFEWRENGAFLIMYMGDQPPGTPDARWLISRDETVPNYCMLYYDNREVSRVYEMSFSDGTWKIWRDSPGFSQRFEGKVGEDGDVISAHWEKSLDGLTWEHDFDVVYTRAR